MWKHSIDRETEIKFNKLFISTSQITNLYLVIFIVLLVVVDVDVDVGAGGVCCFLFHQKNRLRLKPSTRCMVLKCFIDTIFFLFSYWENLSIVFEYSFRIWYDTTIDQSIDSIEWIGMCVSMCVVINLTSSSHLFDQVHLPIGQFLLLFWHRWFCRLNQFVVFTPQFISIRCDRTQYTRCNMILFSSSAFNVFSISATTK